MPTLEEVKHIMGLPMKDKYIFHGLKELLKPEVVATDLHMTKQDVMANVWPKGNTVGLTSKFLMTKVSTFADEENWDPIKVVLTLLIYGVILFPNIIDFVDIPVICVFLTQNVTPTLLAYLYYYLTLRHEKKGRTILYYALLLYNWFLSHFPKE